MGLIDLLIVSQDDYFITKGFISNVRREGDLPFSDYERNCGLWTVIEGIDEEQFNKFLNVGNMEKVPNPLPGPKEIPGNPNIKVPGWERDKRKDATGDKLIPTWNFNANKITPRRRSTLFNKIASKRFDHPGKAKLDRSHSTIWDYGPGRTYSHPQNAFNALLTLVGSTPFTETHYIRGWSGTYNSLPGLYLLREVLNIHDVRPTRKYRLMIDVEEGETVIFDADFTTYLDYTANLVIGDGTPSETISYFSFVDLLLVNGLACLWAGQGNGAYHTCVEVLRCKSIDNNVEGFLLNAMHCISFIDNKLLFPNSSIGCAGVTLDAENEGVPETFIFIGNTFLGSSRSGPPCVFINGRDCDPCMIFINNTFHTTGAALAVGPESVSKNNILKLAIMQNNMFSDCARCIYSFNIEADDRVHVFQSDYNGFTEDILQYFGGAQYNTLAQFQAWGNTDEHSLFDWQNPGYVDPTSPDYDFRLQESSTFRGQGRPVSVLGFDPDELTGRIYPYMDMGAYQNELKEFIERAENWKGPIVQEIGSSSDKIFPYTVKVKQ